MKKILPGIIILIAFILIVVFIRNTYREEFDGTLSRVKQEFSELFGVGKEEKKVKIIISENPQIPANSTVSVAILTGPGAVNKIMDCTVPGAIEFGASADKPKNLTVTFSCKEPPFNIRALQGNLKLYLDEEEITFIEAPASDVYAIEFIVK